MADMTEIKHVLEQMVQSAEKKEKVVFKSLCDRFSHLISVTFHEPMTPIERDYDLCAQSCLYAVSEFVPYEQAMEDVHERLDQIKQYDASEASSKP